MTPPAPKKTKSASGAKGTSRKKTAAAGKTRKAAPKKRRGAKKKKKALFSGLLAAFVAGLVLASAAFWFGRDMSFPGMDSLPRGAGSGAAYQAEESAKEKSRSGKATEKKRAAPDQTKQQDKTRGTKDRPGSGPVVQRPIRPDADGAQALSGRQSAIDSALEDLRNLPFEEPLEQPLDERIRQLDYALMQAAWNSGLAASALRLAVIEDRLDGIEPYQFQVIDVLPGKRSAVFVKELRSCLTTWADGARLAKGGTGEQWIVSVNGVDTHRIRLYPEAKDFPAVPGGASGKSKDAVPSSPAPPNAQKRPMDRPPLRPSGNEPLLVIVIDDLGASRLAVNSLLALEYPVTFAFWPHGAHTGEGARAAHAKGREILVHLPMEPLGYPKVKPGPKVLLTRMSGAEVQRIVSEAIRAVPYASGLNNHMGSRFTQQSSGVGAVLRVLKEQGLLALDSLTHSRSVFAEEARRLGVEHYSRNVFLDVVPSRAAILAELKKAEHIAELTGQAIAIGHPLPETLAALKEWQRLRNKKVRIVRLRDLPGREHGRPWLGAGSLK